MTALAFQPAVELARRVRAREVGCVELLDYYLARLERFDGAVNAVIVREPERARARAAEADRALASGDAVGPLHGVPMTIKESFHWTGTPTTFGFLEFKDNIATSDAAVVERLHGAGAVPVGVQIIGPRFGDLTCLRFARLLEENYRAFVPPPGFED